MRKLTRLIATILLTSPALYAAEPISATTAVLRDVPDMISAEGYVEAVHQSTLAAQIAGQIIERPVNVGDSVKAGQVLVRIDPRSAEQALSGSQSQVTEAQAGLSNALSKHQRNEQLFSQKFISQAALDQSELDAKAARARLAALQSNAGLAATNKTFATITAPYSGVIVATPIEVGDMATAGRALVTMFAPTNMRVVATLSQSELRAVKLNQTAQVEVAGLKNTLSSTQITLIPMADQRTHSATLRLDLGSAGSTSGLLPGQFVRVHFITGMTRKLLIPQTAVLRRSELTGVMILGKDDAPQLRQIRLGEPTLDGNIEVLSGLQAGERIALDPVKATLSAPLSK